MIEYPVEIEIPTIEPWRDGNTGTPFVHSFASGQPGPHLLITAIVHGNEPAGAIALDRFWRSAHAEASTLSIEAACYGRGSPGRVFKLDEESVVDRLIRVGEITRGALSWSETAGLKQVMRKKPLDEVVVLRRAYRPVRSVAA